MIEQLAIPVRTPAPTLPPGIDLRCADITDVIASLPEPCARLIVADPPWAYSQREGVSAAEDHYPGLTIAQIVEHVELCATVALPGARLALWITWPLLGEFLGAYLAQPRRWRYVTGGAWGKVGRMGQGYHWRGDSEAVLLFAAPGATGRPDEAISNFHPSPRTEHSRKPVDWQRAWLRAWTRPGDTVLDLYAGLGSVASACAIESRRYIGAEIDPTRHADAVALIRRDLSLARP